MSNLSDGFQALNALDARVRNAGLADELCDLREKLQDWRGQIEVESQRWQRLVDEAWPACRSAAELAAPLADRLAGLAADPALGVGESRALLAEAADVLQRLADVQHTQSTVWCQLQQAGSKQQRAGQVMAQACRAVLQAEQLLTPARAVPAEADAGRNEGPVRGLLP